MGCRIGKRGGKEGEKEIRIFSRDHGLATRAAEFTRLPSKMVDSMWKSVTLAQSHYPFSRGSWTS